MRSARGARLANNIETAYFGSRVYQPRGEAGRSPLACPGEGVFVGKECSRNCGGDSPWWGGESRGITGGDIVHARFLLAVISVILLSSPARAEHNELHFFGFADVLHTQVQNNPEQSGFGFGQVEIDVEAPVSPGISFEAAVAFDPESNDFGVGAFFVDFDVFDYDVTHHESPSGIDHTGIVVGQFDVPFGIDWQVYPSVDRKLVSAPMAAVRTHGLWNDIGIKAYTAQQWFNVAVFAVNGFGLEAGVDTTGVSSVLGYGGVGYSADSSTVAEMSTRLATGGRLGLNIMDGFEIGGSMAVLYDRHAYAHMWLNGVDLIARWRGAELKGEVIWHLFQPMELENRTNTGAYLQAMVPFMDRWFAVARAGAFWSDEVSAKREDAFSAGLGYALTDHVELRAEYRWEEASRSDVLFTQLAVRF